jgi:hypothetical protein
MTARAAGKGDRSALTLIGALRKSLEHLAGELFQGLELIPTAVERHSSVIPRHSPIRKGVASIEPVFCFRR